MGQGMAILGVALMLVLPQLAGFAAARWWRRASAWPLGAGAAFVAAWYADIWAPAAAAARQRMAQHGCACGLWTVAAAALLVVGLGAHLGGGAFLSWLDRRARRSFPTTTEPRPGP
jgi:hypothetical protein